MTVKEVRMETGAPAPTPENDPSKPVEGTAIPGGVQITPPEPAPTKIETPSTERPAWLPEKFKSPEDLAKAYGEMEKKLGQAKPPAPTSKAKTDAAAEQMDLDALAAEFAETGALSDDTLAALTKRGIPASTVTRYIEGQKALAAQQTAALASVVGGEQKLRDVLTWAGTSLTPSEIAGYNTLVDAGNLDAAKLMLGTFHDRYVATVGTDPKVQVNAQAVRGAGNEAPFASTAEMVTAMRDRRYSEDPAYRKMVERRVAKSTF